MVGEEDIDVGDWSNYGPIMLQTPRHPLLQTKAKKSIGQSTFLLDEVTESSSSQLKTNEAETSISQFEICTRQAETSTRQAETSTRPAETSTRKVETSRVAPSEEAQMSRRRPLLKKKCKASASSKFEELAEKKLKIYEIKERTALLQESTAKMNNIVAKLQMKVALADAKSRLTSEELSEDF